MKIVALDRQLDVDADQPLPLVGVDVEEIVRLPGALGQFRDPSTGQPLDIVLALGHRRDDGVDAVLGDQPAQILLADAGRLRLGAQVAEPLLGEAHVADEQPRHVGAVLAFVPDFHRRDAQPFAVVLLGGDVERAGNGAADVGPVPVGLHQGYEPPLVEDRPDDADIAEVGATQIGIVDGDDVTRVEVVLEGVEHGLRRVVEGADVDGDVLAPLHHRVAVGVAETVREVARVDDEGVAGAQHLLRHLVDEVDEGVFQHLEGDRIELGRGRSGRPPSRPVVLESLPSVAPYVKWRGQPAGRYARSRKIDIAIIVNIGPPVRRHDDSRVHLLDDRRPIEASHQPAARSGRKWRC